MKALKPHHVDECPFVDLPNSKSSRWGGGVTADEMREMQWVKPELVAQIRFVEWTAEGRLRHAAFLGLRSDKSAREVRREANETLPDGLSSARSGRSLLLFAYPGWRVHAGFSVEQGGGRFRESTARLAGSSEAGRQPHKVWQAGGQLIERSCIENVKQLHQQLFRTPNPTIGREPENEGIRMYQPLNITTILPLRHSIGRSPWGLRLTGLTLAVIALSPPVQAVSPPPDGGYPGQNTAVGSNALFSLTSGGANTALGFGALFTTPQAAPTRPRVISRSIATQPGDNTPVLVRSNNTTGFQHGQRCKCAQCQHDRHPNGDRMAGAL